MATADNGKYQILLGYTIFIMVNFAIQAGIGYTVITGNPTTVNKVNCNAGIIGIDGAVSCAWGYLQKFMMFFSMNSSVGLFNVAILVPYTIFVGYLVLEYLKPWGGG